jgi:hypothetical protein
MTNRRSTGNTRTGNDLTPDEAGSPTYAFAPSSPHVSADVSGRVALVLAGFALAVAIFLIILVAIAASNA